MARYLIEQGAKTNSPTSIGYTPLHQAAQQGHCNIVHLLLENNADPNAVTANGQTPLNIAQKLGYISVLDSLKSVTDEEKSMNTSQTEEKYRVVAPEAMHETFMSDSEEEGGMFPLSFLLTSHIFHPKNPFTNKHFACLKFRFFFFRYFEFSSTLLFNRNYHLIGRT